MTEAPAVLRQRRVCLVPNVQGVGGMVSFRSRLAAGLEQRGIQVCYDLADQPYQAVLVIGGTRQLGGLWRARQRGAFIVQRLNGMNWLHRFQADGGWGRIRHYLRAEYGNFILSTVRSRMAQRVVYQSEFSRRWWERVYGPTKAPNQVVYNAVDLSEYSPNGEHERPAHTWRVLMVEGSLMGGYESGLETGVRLVEQLAQAGLDRPVELMVVGRVPSELQQAWEARTNIQIEWVGLVKRAEIPKIDRSAHLLYSADLNAACPNAVIEALACGLPVAAFDTGALAEMVTPEAGRIAPYGGDPWKLDPPDIPALAQACLEVLHDQPGLRIGARRRAEQAFGLEKMLDGYIQALLES